jgi:hypothetical protein
MRLLADVRACAGVAERDGKPVAVARVGSYDRYSALARLKGL